jgi:hypothetical protein
MGSDSSLFEKISPPRSLTERLEAEANGHAGPIEITTASFMAERFAPDRPPLAAEDAELTALASMPQGSAPGGRGAARWASPALLSVLILVALVPTLALGLLLWRGSIDVTGFNLTTKQADRQITPEIQQASIAGSATPETVLPKGDAELPATVLTVASTISAKAGEAAPFPIALDDADALPPRSIITIRGLQEGTSFSAGRPFGETEWSLRPDEIGDLKLMLPFTASGERALSIELVAADGRMISSAGTKIAIAADPRAALILRPEDTARIDELIAHGRKMVEVGYVAGARGYFKRAEEAGSADAAFALGATYDPLFIAQIGAQGIKPDIAQARLWYERAKTLGDKNAGAQITELDRVAAVPAAAPEPSSQAPAVDVASTAPPSPAAPDAASPDDPGGANPEWVEISGPVNVRSAPTPQADTIKIAERGALYQATGRQGSWVQVTDPKTAEVGWVYARYVASAEAPSN